MIKFESFTAREAARITAMDLVTQRDHRRRFPEFLPPMGPKPSYEIDVLLQMSFVKEVAGLNIGPKRAWHDSEIVSQAALYFALHCNGCIKGDLTASCTIPEPSQEDINLYTVRQVYQERANDLGWYGNIIFKRSAFFWGDGSSWFGGSLDEWRDSVEQNDPRIGQPVVSLDLPFFAKKVVDKLPRAAVRILDVGAN
ncbi:hypothetical protein [Roseivivax marinus]|uniref:hypothetical protein n=1 Tax=Roseivivax marinus TaxID=1379903 RepID=UPI0011141BEF|nr:hypothetical protein [Roseivivax marinus]